MEHSFTWLAHDRMEPQFRFVLSTCGITDTSITVLEDENVPRLTVGDHAVLLDSKQGVERSRDVSH